MPDAATRIPTNLITGVLGAGKTTAIQSLLDQKPEHERWAIVINEYGQVAIDNALLDHSHQVEVMELASGCVCCTMSYAFEPLLTQLIQRVKPDRLIIEPSGAGHPARIIDMLRGENFANLLDLRATICLVDPADFENPRIAESTLFNDQLHMSDCVVISWTDKRAGDVIQSCRDKIAAIDPPKINVYETAFGRLDPAWLDAAVSDNIFPRYDPAHSVVNQPTGDLQDLQTTSPQLTTIAQQPSLSTKPRRFENHGNGQWACGWIIAPTAIFDREKIVELTERIAAVRRVKGIFHCQDDWWAINRKGQESSLQPSSYRSDSRLEIIADQPLDWHEIESQLLSTTVKLDV
jgi:G3E family GTPase